MWQRFTERARRTIMLAQEEAGKMRSPHVGTEHLLLGLVREQEGVAALVLRRMNVELAHVLFKVKVGADSSSEVTTAEPKLTPAAKRVLEVAANEAQSLRHNYIGTEHLLLALLRQPKGEAARILEELDLKLETTRAEVLNYLSAGPESNEPPFVPRLRIEVDDSKADRFSSTDFAVLLSLILQKDNVARDILSECGLDIAQAQERVEKLLKERQVGA